MDRRSFLRHALAAVPVIAAPAAVLDALEPKRTIFLPPKGGWVGDGVQLTSYSHRMYGTNYIVTPDALSEHALEELSIEIGKRYARELAASMQLTKESLMRNILNEAVR